MGSFVRCLFVAAVMTLAAGVASASIVVRGRSFESWSDYYTSPEYAARTAAPARCGTPDPFQKIRNGTLAPSDCSLSLTNPAEQYEPAVTLEIQVVVHRLESSVNAMGVFPDSLVQTQIDVMNEDYLAAPGTLGAPGKNVRVVFRLATQDPQGNPSPGWTRTTNEFWFNDLPDPLNGNYYDVLAWDPVHYLNIYTLSPEAPGGVVLGYVPFFPQEGGAGTNEDGVRCLWNAFGRESSNAPYNLGRTVTHEVGHYLGLLHAFQGGCTPAAAPDCYSTGDLVCDTEPDESSHGGCPTDAATCGDPDPIRNYMEYTDDACMNNFTPEQARRIRCTIQYYRPDLARTVLAVDPAHDDGVALALRVDPNPVATSAQISFRLERAGHVAVDVVDITGRTVRTLRSEPLSSGIHRSTWDGRNTHGLRVAPGAYYARIRTAEGNATRSIMLLH